MSQNILEQLASVELTSVAFDSKNPALCLLFLTRDGSRFLFKLDESSDKNKCVEVFTGLVENLRSIDERIQATIMAQQPKQEVNVTEQECYSELADGVSHPNEEGNNVTTVTEGLPTVDKGE